VNCADNALKSARLSETKVYNKRYLKNKICNIYSNYVDPEDKLDIHVSMHHDIIYENDQQHATV
jgi:hypothetical protein